MGLFECDDKDCDVDCEWSAWSPWSECDATCGYGSMTRSRDVQVPAEYDGVPCTGPETDTDECYAGACDCPNNMEWSLRAPDCPCTCENMYNMTDICATVSEGCTCPKGLVLWEEEQKCVEPHECSCIIDGIPRLPDETWPGEDECTTCRCIQGQEVCDEPVCQTCPDNCTTVMEPGKCCPTCQCEPPKCQLVSTSRVLEDDNGCVTDGPVSLSYCSGGCPSVHKTSSKPPFIIQDCSCCTGQYSVKSVDFTCPNGQTTPQDVFSMDSCSCEQCASSTTELP